MIVYEYSTCIFRKDNAYVRTVGELANLVLKRAL